MHIRITETRGGSIYEVLCDVCGQAIDLDEDCDYLFPQSKGVRREAKLAHSSCARAPGRAPLLPEEGCRECAKQFPDGVVGDHWTQMMKPRYILQHMLEQNRSPVITDFLRQLKQDQKERLKRS